LNKALKRKNLEELGREHKEEKEKKVQDTRSGQVLRKNSIACKNYHRGIRAKMVLKVQYVSIIKGENVC